MANVSITNTDVTTDDATVISPESNVLQKGATKDEVDVHWHFNFAEGELSPPVMYSPYDQALLGRRVSTSGYVEIPEPSPLRLAAATRSRRIRAILDRLSPTHVSALCRWSAPPSRIPADVRTLFGRLAAVAALTSSFDEIGGSARFLETCARANARKDRGDGTANYLRHHARVKLAVVREEAQAVIAAAFAAYAAARVAVDDEARRSQALRVSRRAPALARVAKRHPANDTAVSERGGTAMARLRARKESK
jgi:hypothetical protein